MNGLLAYHHLNRNYNLQVIKNLVLDVFVTDECYNTNKDALKNYEPRQGFKRNSSKFFN